MPIGVPALYRAMIETRVPSRQFESMLRFRKTRKRDSKCFQELFVGKTSCLVPQTPNCPFLNRTCSLSKGPHEVIGLLQECQNNILWQTHRTIKLVLVKRRRPGTHAGPAASSIFWMHVQKRLRHRLTRPQPFSQSAQSRAKRARRRRIHPLSLFAIRYYFHAFNVVGDGIGIS